MMDVVDASTVCGYLHTAWSSTAAAICGGGSSDSWLIRSQLEHTTRKLWARATWCRGNSSTGTGKCNELFYSLELFRFMFGLILQMESEIPELVQLGGIGSQLISGLFPFWGGALNVASTLVRNHVGCTKGC